MLTANSKFILERNTHKTTAGVAQFQFQQGTWLLIWHHAKKKKKKIKKNKLAQAIQHYTIRTSRFSMQHTWFQLTTETLLL